MPWLIIIVIVVVATAFIVAAIQEAIDEECDFQPVVVPIKCSSCGSAVENVVWDCPVVDSDYYMVVKCDNCGSSLLIEFRITADICTSSGSDLTVTE